MQPEFFANSTLTPHRQNGIVIANYRLLQFNFETAGCMTGLRTVGHGSGHRESEVDHEHRRGFSGVRRCNRQGVDGASPSR